MGELFLTSVLTLGEKQGTKGNHYNKNGTDGIQTHSEPPRGRQKQKPGL